MWLRLSFFICDLGFGNDICSAAAETRAYNWPSRLGTCHAEEDCGEQLRGAWILRQDWPWSEFDGRMEKGLIVCSHQPAAPQVLSSVAGEVGGIYEVHTQTHPPHHVRLCQPVLQSLQEAKTGASIFFPALRRNSTKAGAIDI